MTMLRFGPLLAIAGAACLVAWTPEGRLPPEVAALDRAPASPFDALATETASVTGAARSASVAPPILGYGSASSAVADRAAPAGGGPERCGPRVPIGLCGCPRARAGAPGRPQVLPFHRWLGTCRRP